MTRRDRIVIIAVGSAVLVAAFVMLVLKPRQAESAKLGTEVAAQRQQLEAAQASLTAGRAARASYPANYATVARLGKAVPLDDDVPSLVYQVSSTADSTGVDFRTLKLQGGGSAPAPPAPAPAATAAAASAPGAATGSGSSAGGSSSGGSSSSSSSATPPASGSSAPSGGAATSSASASTSSTPAPAAPAAPGAPATQATTATLPPGATVGTAGFPTMPFSFSFEGNFFRLANFFRRLERYVHPAHRAVDVTGRLLMIDGISLTASPRGFPRMQASVAATTYLLPAGQGATGGATPTAPAAPGAPQPVSSSAPPTSPSTSATATPPTP
jgi:hypothetical protein